MSKNFNKINLNLLYIIIISIPVTIFFKYIKFPAYPLIGTLLVTILFSLLNKHININRSFFLFIQSLFGCYLSRSISIEFINTIVNDWHTILFMTLTIIIFSILVAKLMQLITNVSLITSVCSLLPGGAAVMTVISDDFGANVTIVAIVQYLRVLIIILSLSILLLFYPHTEHIDTYSSSDIFNLNFLYTMLIGIFCFIMCSKYIKFPASNILLPLIICGSCNYFGLFTVEMPIYCRWLIFGVFGLNIGSKFNIKSIKQVIKMLNWIIFFILLIILFGFFQSVLLYYWMDLDFLSCILAGSPGGIDIIMIIVTETGSNLNVILSIQLARMLSIIALSPLIINFISKITNKN